MAVLIGILGGIAYYSMPKDIYPVIDIPVVSVVWAYGGVPPVDMANRIVTICERALTTTVNDIEHIESSSYGGVSVIRIFFQRGAKVELAIAQVTAIVQTILRVMPPGVFPPNVIKYDAATVPILQLGISSDTLTEAELFDYGQNFIRTQLATVQGASIPLPFGGKFRAIMVDIDPNQLYAKGLSATDVSNAFNLQNLILPAGTVKVGSREYQVLLNSSPSTVDALNDLPVKTVNGATVYVRDIAQVRDGFNVQTNIVRVNGTRAALLTVLKSGRASTLDIVEGVKTTLPKILAGLPRTLKVKPLFDQSLFVRDAIVGVAREAAIAAGLTALMILLFLGSWRSTLIVCTSIPLSILTSLAILGALGQTVNVMTLGGLALAVGILVDDATVEIENIHRNLSMKKPIIPAILDGAQQIALPAFVSTLSICIVFVPVLLLTGPARFLFTPLAMAVVFAMLMSYFLTRTLVPTMVHYMLPPEVKIYQHPEKAAAVAGENIIWRLHHRFEVLFENLRERYHGALAWTLHHRARTGLVFGLLCLACIPLAWVVGTDFFPYVDSGLMKLHVRTPAGTRIEVTEQIFGDIEAEIRRQIPPDALQTILDNIGLPASGVNLAYGDTATIGSFDGDILIALKTEEHRTQEYQRKLRRVLREKFPDIEFVFQAANITNQILNFGLPAAMDIQVVGRDTDANYRIAADLVKRVSTVPGAVDVNLRQEVASPALQVNVDRTRAGQSGLTQRDVANSALISLSSSGQVAPNQWLNPVNGVNYFVSVQTPQYKIDSFDALRRMPITSGSNSGVAPQLLDNLVTTQRTTAPSLVSHYEIQPVFDVFVNVDRRDLGSVAADVDKILDKVRQQVPRGTIVRMRGQVQTMRESFVRLGFGVVFAIVLVYLLMVVNFQSWLDPFIILTALPAAFAGILIMLFVSQTTLNVPSLMGAIMAIGVATANSILLVTFANDERAEGKDALEAALSAGYTRMRPVIMTALAMIIGMLPMALAFGEGGEQNAPLGRAVIGGLLFATVSTLFFVPVMYTLLRRKPPIDYDRQIDLEAHERFDPNAEAPAPERA